MKKKISCHCGQEVSKKLISDGYLSGIELGRNKGSKGIDLAHIGYFCPEHGEVTNAISEVIIPEWFDNLTTFEIMGLTITAKGVYDSHGNYLFGLPVKEPKNWEVWITSEIEAFIEYGE